MIENYCMCPSTVLSLAPIFCRFFRLQMLFILFLSFVSPCHSAGTPLVDWTALHVPFNFPVSRTQLSSLYIIGFHQSFNQFLSVVTGFHFIIFSTRFCVSHGFSSCFQPISSFHHLFNPLSFRHCCSSVFNPFIIFSPSFSPFLHVIMAFLLQASMAFHRRFSPFLHFTIVSHCFFNLFLHFIIVFSSCFQHFLDFLVKFASFQICLRLILPSKALCRHVCSNLCMATFLSSISACYFHKSTQLSYHQCLMCIFAVVPPHFCSTILKIEKLEVVCYPPRVSGPRAFLYLPRLLSGEN